MHRRISRAMAIAVVATLVLVGLGTFVLARVATRSQDLRRLETTAERTNEVLVTVDQALLRAGERAERLGVGTAAVRRLRSQLLAALSISGMSQGVLSADGRFAGDLPTGVRRADLDLAALRAGTTISGQRGNTLWAAAASAESRDGRDVTSITVLTEERERFLGPTFRWFLVSALAAVAIALAVSMWLGRRLAAPVHAAVATTRRIADGDLAARLPQPAAGEADELAVLARSINAMADGLERARDQERQFLLSVSHDLRTPLTSIRGYAEAIADGAADDPARAATVIVAESRRLERLVGDLLDLARIDVDRFELHPRPTDLGDAVAGVVAGFAPELADADISLRERTEHGSPVVALVDVDRLAQVVANLLTNAVSFARTTVWVSVRRDGDHAVVEVADDGAGIPAASLPHVFDRLYQADNQPARRGRGTGLGLAIVAELCARMGGRCDVASVEGTGTTFSARFPLAP